MARKETDKGLTAASICFLLGLADAKMTLFPLNWFRTGKSRGKGRRGPFPGGGPFLAGKAPC